MNKILSDTRIAIKIIVPLIFIALVGLAGAAYSGWQMKKVDSQYGALIKGESVAMVKLVRINRSMQALGYAIHRGVGLDNTSAAAREVAEDARASDQKIVELIAEAQALAPAWAEDIEALRPELDEIRALAARSLELTSVNNVEAGQTVMREMDAKIAVLTPQLTALNNAKIIEGEQDSAALSAKVNSTVMFTVGSLLVLSIATLLAALMITSKGVVGPVNRMVGLMRRLLDGDTGFEVPGVVRKDEVGEIARSVVAWRDGIIEKVRLEAESLANRSMSEKERAANEADKARIAAEDAIAIGALAEGLSAIANGDLTHRFTAEVTPKAQQLKTDFNAAVIQLQESISVVVTNVSAIRSGAGEISQAADDLSRRTEQQAASLEETAAALDEITSTVNRTASGAKQASETVQAAKGDAETSGNVVRDAVGAMGAIEKSAQEISQIIGVIDEIAFQTNLLALNAGVEAARAGDAGRGFAVVASEVRALAQRSAEAAKEIKVLISASTTQVNAGVALVGQTGEALQRIVSRVAEIDTLVSEIAASAQEQATGLQQVNTAVNQMDQVTQQNAAMVEQSTAASHSLSQEAETLANSVSRFQIGAAQASSAGAKRTNPVHAAQARIETYARPAAKSRVAPRSVGNTALKTNEWEEF